MIQVFLVHSVTFGPLQKCTFFVYLRCYVLLQIFKSLCRNPLALLAIPPSTPHVIINSENYLNCPFLFDVILRVQCQINDKVEEKKTAALSLRSARTDAHLLFHPGNQKRDPFPFNNFASQRSGLCHKTACARMRLPKTAFDVCRDSSCRPSDLTLSSLESSQCFGLLSLSVSPFTRRALTRCTVHAEVQESEIPELA